MCGIAGKWSRAGTAVPSRALLEQMALSLAHRGPDADGIWSGDQVGLAHRRLSVIDLAGGAQPMVAGDDARDVVIVHNGEVFNFLGLRAELETKGHRFTTRSDTEVIARGYLEWGDELPERLVGQFAFVIWDGRARRLFGARDRLGQKPLYVAQRGGDVWFASEVKAMLQDPALTREADWQAMDLFLRYGYVPGPLTGFKGIRKIPPGHALTVEADGPVVLRRYWEPEGDPEPMGDREAEETIETLLGDAVRARQVADVPLGALLSGGIDSSLVASYLSDEGPLKTFAAGFDEAEYDESMHAAEVAQHLGTDHLTLETRPDAARVLPRMVWHFDEPFADASAIPVFELSRLTREHVTVALSGDGGDESFAGYDRYVTPRGLGRWQRIPRLVRSVLATGSSLAGGTSAGLVARAFDFNSRSLQTLEDRYLMGHNKGDRHLSRDSVYGSALRLELESVTTCDDLSSVDRCLAATRGPHALPRMQHADLRSYLVDDVNMKVDRMSMAHGLEIRAPFLDHRVVEAALRLPLSLRTQDEQTKLLLRRMAARRLPASVARRPKKGFTVPLGRWFKRDLAEAARLLASRSLLAKEGVLDQSVLRRLASEHAAGAFDWGGRLWMLLNLEVWYRTFIAAGPGATPPEAGLNEVFE